MNIAILAAGVLVLSLLPMRLQGAKLKETTVSAFKIPQSAAPYLDQFAAAERHHNLPTGLLTRMAKQESNYDPKAVSPAGAIGLMQIIPKWHPNVNPWNPVESIWYAGGYVRQLREQFGSWEMALAAYNWGPGNLERQGFDQAPRETRNYVAQIGADVRLA